MIEEERPNPEELLQAIEKQESRQKRGKLKIFLGMAAGVGKTYTMLEEAHELVKDGVDLVIGTINTHGRTETAELLQGLTIIPEKIVRYHDKDFHELDLETIIKRKPELVLVDELAHSNVPGLKHDKRWQDVLEILENGISVYTTLNVQHIESLKDVVEGIAEIPVRETVPDRLIEIATEIRLVDITPEGLLQRLKEGKVYLGDQSQVAAQHFFQKDRLTALREIVMRYAAEKVDRELADMAVTDDRIHWWKPREKILVAISHSPLTQKLLRNTRRTAYALNAPWIAVYVDTGRTLSDDENNQLERNIALARNLGAEVITTKDPSVAEGIKRIAHQKSVTQIILGRPPSAPILGIFRRFELLDTLTAECPGIDVHVIRQERIQGSFRKLHPLLALQNQFSQYLIAFIWIVFLAALNKFALSYTGSYKLAGVFFLIGILAMSLFLKKGPVLFASIMYAVIWDFYFIPPVHHLYNLTNEDSALVILYVLTAITTGILVDRAREHKEMLQKSEETIQSYYDIVKQIAAGKSLADIIKTVVTTLEKKLPNGTFEILIKQIDNGLTFETPSKLLTDEKEKNAAIWVFETGKEAGWSTDTLPSAKNLYIPLKDGHEVFGVIIYHPIINRTLSMDDKNYIYAIGNQISSYLERNFEQQRKHTIDQLTQQEQMYESALNSISQELQPPLASIQESIYEAVQELKGVKISKKGDPHLQQQVHKIEDSSDDLTSILDNVTAIAKLSGPISQMNKAPKNVKEFIVSAVEKIKKDLSKRTLINKIPDNIIAPLDPTLMEIILHNLLHTAVKRTPIESPITIEGRTENDSFVLAVIDEGPALPSDLIKQIYESETLGTEFSSHMSNEGIGSRLMLARKIAEVHGGKLEIKNLEPKGVFFGVYIPA